MGNGAVHRTPENPLLSVNRTGCHSPPPALFATNFFFKKKIFNSREKVTIWGGRISSFSFKLPYARSKEQEVIEKYLE